MNYSIDRLRNILLEELKDYPGEPILLPFEDILMERLLFNRSCCGKEFASQLKEILTKINYSNVSFKDFCAREFDFTPYIGVKINPELLYKGMLVNAKCKGVEFVGSFYGVNIKGTNFEGSHGAKINPQVINNKSLCGTICADVEFVGLGNMKADFSGVDVSGANFKGSRGAIINPYKLEMKSLKNTICADVIFEVPDGYRFDFNGIDIEGTDFNGSNFEETIKFENEFREKIKLMTNGNVHIK